MLFRAYSQSARQALAHFRESTARSALYQRALLHRRAQLCDFEVTLVALDAPQFGDTVPEREKQRYLSLQESWKCACSETTEFSVRQKAWQSVLGFGTPVLSPEPWFAEFAKRGISQVPTSPSEQLLKDRESSNGSRFFILFKGNEQYGIPLDFVQVLANRWQVEQGHLPVHAAGVIRERDLFLFAGPSGAGKSTAIGFGAQWGCQVLDEDQVLIHPLNESMFTADAWGYDLIPGQVPLRAIFFLNQDGEDRLAYLPQTQVARRLLEGNRQLMGTSLSGTLIERVLKIAAEIARHVPGYDLYFRRSPDFWKLIIEQFHG